MSLLGTVLLSFGLGALVGAFLASVIAWGRMARARMSQVFPPVDPEVPVVIDSLRQPAMVVGPHDEVLHSSVQARTIGLARGTRIGMTEVLDEVREARRSQTAMVREVRVRGVDGGPARQLLVRVQPLERDAVLVVSEDQSAMVRADESKRDLVANISHELKTPVGALQVLSETVQEAADDPEQVRKFATRMTVESKRLGELVRQIIELSRLQSDDPLLEADVVDIDDVVSEAAAQNRNSAKNHKVQFSVAGTTGQQVVGDEGQLINAVSNLIENALAYSDPGARVSVTTSRVDEADDHWVEIAVTDNGIGIRPEDQERIFERFYRVDYARSRDNGGTGLGLSIVKHIIAGHGGTISVWSRLGQGSTFTIRLPENTIEAGVDTPWGDTGERLGGQEGTP
ncbi:sensor histidine kinase [Propionibacterium sp.]|uniref:sensor histidine kinase n=1 Tax=Propionibacterium sp. TaxID=1977903 RepID=UPI0039EAF596